MMSSRPTAEPSATEERGLGSVWLMLVLPPVSLGAVIFAYIGIVQLTPSAPGFEQRIEAALPYLLAVNHVSLFLLLLWILRRRGETLSEIGWSVGDSSLPAELVVGLAAALGLYLFKEFAIDSLSAMAEGRGATFTSLFRFDLGQVDVAMAVAASGLVFIEESIYRGFAIPRLRRRFGVVAAVVLSTMFFALLHWGNGPFALVSSFLLGLLFASLYLWRGDLVAPTVAHAGYNLLVLAVV